MSTNTLTYNNAASLSSGKFWIRDRNWDLTFISLSAVLVFIPLASYYFGGENQNSPSYAQFMSKMVDYFVAACIGGPHMFATFLRTFMDKGFVKSKPIVTWTSLLIPVVVIAIGISNARMPLLLTIFFPV